MKQGDIVIEIDGHNLSGPWHYTHAIVVSMDPFILMSEDADMRWNLQEAKDFKAIGRAFPKQLKQAMRRLKKERAY